MIACIHCCGKAKIKALLVIQNELAVVDGLVINDRRIVIPKSLQENILSQLHLSHMGEDKVTCQKICSLD